MSPETLPLKLLTQNDLDERIGRVVAELFAEENALMDETQDWAPVAIDPAEFVRRMRRFMVYN
ncbi:MAG: hypothetical protein IH848_11235 [Acidobacteria bacterium]|nr:hypothetical protein [Acidobacteriota bacterium]